MIEDEEVILFQAKQICELERNVVALTKENVRLNQSNRHHHRMREQQEGIINDLRKVPRS